MVGGPGWDGGQSAPCAREPRVSETQKHREAEISKPDGERKADFFFSSSGQVFLNFGVGVRRRRRKKERDTREKTMKK